MKIKWKKDNLFKVVAESKSKRQVLSKLGLVEAGGNYDQLKKYLQLHQIDTSHFTGYAWNKGLRGRYMPTIPLSTILVKGSSFQSFKLKKRLFIENIKSQKCEDCGWAKMSNDGRIPLELDHINGDKYDNRIENLRVLCPNCHSLRPTHRGRNKHRTPGW